MYFNLIQVIFKLSPGFINIHCDPLKSQFGNSFPNVGCHMADCANCGHASEVHSDMYGCRICNVCGEWCCDTDAHVADECGCKDFVEAAA